MNTSATLTADAMPSLAFEPGARFREGTLDQSRALDVFLQEVEKRAFRMAQIAMRNPDDALDIVQEAMLQLVRAYGSRPADEWRPLFYRILQNRIHDWQRRRRTRGRVIAWWTGGRAEDDEDAADPIESAAAEQPDPSAHAEGDEIMVALERALRTLPARQREAFLLRNFEGMDVAETARAMGCGEGSVKTHYFRAVQALREQLGDHWGES